MKKKIAVLVSFCLIMSGVVACAQAPEEDSKNVELKTFTDKVSYMVGMDIGASIKDTKTEINLEALYNGLEDSLKGRDLKLEPEQIVALKLEFTEKLQKEHAARIAAAGQKNLAEGEAFLAENKGKEGVVTTDSGLQYKVLIEGDGPMPTATDQVKVNYRGTLIGGKEFDSSYERQEPVNFMVGSVIPGWIEALQMMKVGSKYQLFIPPALAYGDQDVSSDIGPNTTLIFEVELLGIE